jgi:hypothetical protein
MIKFKALRLLVTAKQWANTEKGESTIVTTLTIMSIMCITCMMLLLYGCIFF